jgi:anti-sigma factor RsiW
MLSDNIKRNAMNINRNNYEQFFIMYVDNELSAEERMEVEAFVASNPDLEVELEMFREVVLQPEPQITFPGKEILFKNSNPVTEENYEEYFVLYGDDELNREQKEFVEQFVYRHPQFQADFELILKARVVADNSIVYPDKSELFRYERKGGAVVKMQWMRAVAAAVIFVFLGGMGWMFVQQENKVHMPNGEVVKTGIEEVNDRKIDELKTEGSEELASSQVVAMVSGDERKKVTETGNIHKGLRVSVVEVMKKETGEVKQNGIEELESVRSGVAIVENSSDRKPIIDEAIGEEQLRGLNNVGNAVAAAPEVQQVSNVVYIEQEPDRSRNKSLRGLVRKATRIFEKTTNIDPANKDNKVQIAGFEIALK